MGTSIGRLTEATAQHSMNDSLFSATSTSEPAQDRFCIFGRLEQMSMFKQALS